MKPEIKQRIEQLNNGKIPKGYKKTDFGVFPSDWVTDKKLIDIGTFGKGKGIPGNKMQSDGVPCVGYGDIYMKYNHFYFEEAQSFVDEETAKDSQLIKKGTLLFTGTGETAEEIGKCVCYNGYSTICAGGDIITFVPQDVNPLFLAYQQYQNFSLKKKASFGQGHSVVHIQKESLEKLNVAYPESKNEQSRIVEILMKWDEAIELYNKQIDALTRYKKVCLKKMFPIKGQSVPEWRFQGFSGDWEQRKLGDIASDMVAGGDIDKDLILAEGQYPVIANALTGDGIVGYYDKEYRVNAPAVTVTGRGDVGHAKARLVNFTPVVRLLSVKSEHDVFFLENAINTLKIVIESTGVPQLTVPQLAKYEVAFPRQLNEEEHIGAFFKQFDHLIALHQRKKEVITNQRKTLQQYLLNGIIRV